MIALRKISLGHSSLENFCVFSNLLSTMQIAKFKKDIRDSIKLIVMDLSGNYLLKRYLPKQTQKNSKASINEVILNFRN